MPANGDKPWGDVVRNAIFDVSDRADLALSTASSASSTASTALSTANTANTAATANSSAITTLQTTVAGKADDSVVVKLTGNQTIAGTKTFSSAPAIPDGSYGTVKINGLDSALSGKANTSHNHDTSNITTGLFSLARVPAGYVHFQSSSDTVRATNRTDIHVLAVGGSTPPSWLLAGDIHLADA